MSGIIQLMLAGAGKIFDQYFEYVTMLLPGNGTNGAQNNTFLDSSPNNFSIARGGNTAQGTFSPFSQTGWSGYLDGNGDFLSVPSTSSAFNFTGTKTLTFECWVYLTGLPDNATLFDIAESNPFRLIYAPTGYLVWQATSSATNILVPACTLPLNTWNHIAFVRDEDTVSAYVNGSRIGTGTYTSNWTSSGSTAYVGCNRGNTWFVQGYMSNVRLVKGTALYSGATYSVPTAPLTNVSGTSLLTCQSNRFIDNSSNAFAITANGNVSAQAFSPFNPTVPYSASAVGGSAYFDGSGDYLSAGASTSFAFGTGNFTVEAWLYVTAVATYQTIFSSRGTGAAGTFCGLETGTTQPVLYTNSTKVCQSSVSLPLNTWNHVVYTRNGGTTSIYVNGVSVASAADSTNYTSNFGVLSYDVQDNNWPFYGYMSSVRVVNGTAVYTGNFTPPTAPLTAIGNTQLLINSTNAGIYDATAKNNLETVGNAQISTTQSKFGGSSMYFDGTGDGLVGRSTQLASFGTGDFTVEGWVYLTSITGADRYLFTTGNGIDNSLRLYLDSTGKVAVFTSFTLVLTSTNPLVVNTWTHVAVCRYNGTLTVYINGVQNGTASYSTAINCNGNISVGSDNNGGSSMIGYLDDMRVTKGIARYTSNFTPPTAAFPLE